MPRAGARVTKIVTFLAWRVVASQKIRNMTRNFEWRYINGDDLRDVVTGWWCDWDFPIPPPECLPERGVIVSDGDGDLYAGYLYLTDGRIGWMEWVVSNRAATPARKRGALAFLTDVLSGMAKQEGMLLVFTSTSIVGYRNGLEKCGFLLGDTNTYQLIKGL